MKCKPTISEHFVVLLVLSSLFFLPAAAFSEPTPLDPLARLRENVVKVTLSNGLRVLIDYRPQAPVFTANTWVRVGGVNEVPGSTGLSHFLEHMAFKGTKTIGTLDYKREKVLLDELEQLVAKVPVGEDLFKNPDYQRIERELRKVWVEDEYSTIYSRRGEVGLNAMTSNDFTAYEVSLPKTAFEFWCWMESDRLIEPVFRQFYKEREVITEERRMRSDDDPDGKAFEALLSSAFWSHPNRYPDIGWPSDIKRVTETQMEKHWQTYYRPDNSVVTLVGDINPKTAVPLLEKYFSRWKNPATSIPQVTTEEMAQEGERDITVEFDAEPRLMLGYHVPVYPNADELHMELLHEVLSGSRSSILYRELILQKQIAAGIQTSDDPSMLYPTLFDLFATPRAGVTLKRLRDEIQSIFDRIAEQGVSREDLEGARARLRIAYLRRMSSNSGYAYLLGISELIWGNWNVLFERYNGVLSTTSDDLREFAKKYLRPKNRTVIEVHRPETTLARKGKKER